MHMDIRRGSPHAHVARRIGKKAIFYGRIAPTLGVVPPAPAAGKKPGIMRTVRAYRPTKKHLAIVIGVVVFITSGVVGGYFYQQKIAADERAAAQAAAQKAEKANAVAQQCYRQKTAEKTDMLGKITFDQLYDGDACTTQQ